MKHRRACTRWASRNFWPGRYDDAAQSLLAASREQPDNARYLSDVAAVQLERARLGLRPDDLPRALAAADRARRLDPSLREAWFNRALAATALSLNDQAKQAWTEYLAARQRRRRGPPRRATRLDGVVEADSRRRRGPASKAGCSGPIDAALADEAVRAQTTEARNFIENELLPAVGGGGRSAAASVARARTASAHGRRVARVAGDALYRDAVAAIDRAEARGGDAVARLARGARAIRRSRGASLPTIGSPTRRLD